MRSIPFTSFDMAFTGQTARDYLSSARELKGGLLYQSNLSEPLGELELLFTIFTELRQICPGLTLFLIMGGVIVSFICSCAKTNAAGEKTNKLNNNTIVK